MKGGSPRIISGIYKNIRLDVPSSARPMTDRIKQSVFDLVSEFLKEASVLDLYAGAGNIGIEALSRGADSTTFVEIDKEAQTKILKNIEKLKPQPKYSLVSKPVEKFLIANSLNFDLVFADPPFLVAEEFPTGRAISALKSNGLLVLRVPTEKVDQFNHLKPSHTEIYGESTVYFLRKMQ